jgi:hypothetical protein
MSEGSSGLPSRKALDASCSGIQRWGPFALALLLSLSSMAGLHVIQQSDIAHSAVNTEDFPQRALANWSDMQMNGLWWLGILGVGAGLFLGTHRAGGCRTWLHTLIPVVSMLGIVFNTSLAITLYIMYSARMGGQTPVGAESAFYGLIVEIVLGVLGVAAGSYWAANFRVHKDVAALRTTLDHASKSGLVSPTGRPLTLAERVAIEEVQNEHRTQMENVRRIQEAQTHHFLAAQEQRRLVALMEGHDAKPGDMPTSYGEWVASDEALKMPARIGVAESERSAATPGSPSGDGLYKIQERLKSILRK